MSVWDRIKAWWRGEHRTAPAGARGRIYTRTTGVAAAHTKLEAKVRMRVYKSELNKWFKVNPDTGALEADGPDVVEQSFSAYRRR